MKKTTGVWLAVIFLSFSLGGASCKSDDKDNEVLTVGGVLSKTGGAAAYGGDADRGARLALEQIEQKDPSFQVKYVSLDDKSDKTEAAKVARTLIDANDADVILGPAISPSALVVGKLAEEREVPIVGTSPTQDEVTYSDSYDREYVFRVCFNDSFQGRILAKFVAEDLDKKTAAIIYDKTLSYSIGLANTFRKQFEELGGAVEYEENYSVKDTDYSALIDKVAEYDVDVLFIPGWDENVGPMLKQAGDKWNKFTLIGGDAWPSNRLLELAAGNIHDAYALSHYIPEDPDPRVQSFNDAYKKKYGEPSSPFAALGYDAMMLIWDAAKRAGSNDPRKIRDALASTSDLELVTGKLSFDEHRNPLKDAVIVKIEPKAISFFKRVRL